MRARTSVQTGLEGLGKEDAQSKMLEEFGGAPGTAGKKETIIDIEAEKSKEVAKPLAGQRKLKRTKQIKSMGGAMKSVEELEQELYESEVSSEALADSVSESKVADLTGLVSKTGKMRGHLTGLTPRQYERVIGRKPPPGLLIKARDATTRKVQWDMVLDQLTSERGYSSDEQLRDAIEKAHDDKQELEQAKANQKALRNEIMDKLRAEPEVESIKLDDVCPQFPESTCVAEVVMVNGMQFRLRRQHSYWRVDAGDKSFRIRYARDARKLATAVKRDYKEKIKTARVAKLKHKRKRRPRKFPPLTQSLSGMR